MAGVVYVDMDGHGAWKQNLVRKLRAAGYEGDRARVLFGKVSAGAPFSSSAFAARRMASQTAWSPTSPQSSTASALTRPLTFWRAAAIATAGRSDLRTKLRRAVMFSGSFRPETVA
jgi:hypothetical protein